MMAYYNYANDCRVPYLIPNFNRNVLRVSILGMMFAIDF